MLEQANTKQSPRTIPQSGTCRETGLRFLETAEKQSLPISFIGGLLIATPGLPKKEVGEGEWFDWGNTMKVFEKAELFLYLLNLQAKLLQE